MDSKCIEQYTPLDSSFSTIRNLKITQYLMLSRKEWRLTVVWGIKPDWRKHNENKENKEETINSSVYESLTEERKCKMVPIQIVIS